MTETTSLPVTTATSAVVVVRGASGFSARRGAAVRREGVVTVSGGSLTI
jgi:hypothetical protein